jgi:hypothetical protein
MCGWWEEEDRKRLSRPFVVSALQFAGCAVPAKVTASARCSLSYPSNDRSNLLPGYEPRSYVASCALTWWGSLVRVQSRLPDSVVGSSTWRRREVLFRGGTKKVQKSQPRRGVPDAIAASGRLDGCAVLRAAGAVLGTPPNVDAVTTAPAIARRCVRS